MFKKHMNRLQCDSYVSPKIMFVCVGGGGGGGIEGYK